MTAGERSSLRSAVLIAVALYAAIFAGLSLLPFGAIAGAKRSSPARSPALRIDLATNEISAGAAASSAARGSAAPRRAAPQTRKAAQITVPAGNARPAEPYSSAAAGRSSAHTEPVNGNSSAARGAPPKSALSASSPDSPTPSNPAASESASSPTLARQQGAGDRVADQPPRAVGAGEASGTSGAVSAAREAALYGRNSLARAGSAARGPGSVELTATGGAASVGQSQTAGAAETVRALLAVIRERVVRERVYPPAAKRRGIQGSVTVAASVGPDGRLLAVHVVRSSGSEILDEAGVGLLRKVFPVENPLLHGFTLELPITYRLQPAG